MQVLSLGGAEVGHGAAVGRKQGEQVSLPREVGHGKRQCEQQDQRDAGDAHGAGGGSGVPGSHAGVSSRGLDQAPDDRKARTLATSATRRCGRGTEEEKGLLEGAS